MSQAPLAVAERSEAEAAQALMYLTFILGAELFGIRISAVTEIIGLQNITRIPNVPGHIRGVINLRGSVIPLMDVRIRFGMGPREYDNRTCIIVVRIEQVEVGLLVDTVQEVVTIPQSRVAPAPGASGTAEAYIEGMGRLEGDKVVILIDPHRLLENTALR